MAEVLVHEGSDVSAGAALIILDAEKAKSAERSYREQFAANSFQIARLEAEQSNTEKLHLPTMSDGIEIASFNVLANLQTELFEARRLALQSKLKVLSVQRMQAEDVIRAAEAQLVPAKFRLESVGRDLSNAKFLFQSHDGTLDRVTSLERSVAELRAAEAEQEARVDGGHRKAELDASEIQKTLMDAKEEVANDLQRARIERPELREKLDAETFRVSHLTVTAPVAGKVSALSVHTAGSVLGPGQVVAEIVPQNGSLEIEAHVRPEDISHIRPGLSVDITLNGIDSQYLPHLTGQVNVISPDRLIDKISGQPYFGVKVSCELDRGMADLVVPGMGADIWINLGNRSVAHYLIEPIIRFMHLGLRDR